MLWSCSSVAPTKFSPASRESQTCKVTSVGSVSVMGLQVFHMDVHSTPSDLVSAAKSEETARGPLWPVCALDKKQNGPTAGKLTRRHCSLERSRKNDTGISPFSVFASALRTGLLVCCKHLEHGSFRS